jgi:predicted SAM-dependent methyltransferase
MYLTYKNVKRKERLMDWNELTSRHEPKINIGGYGDTHPNRHYEDWISVDIDVPSPWGIAHDLTKTFPIEDCTVSAILSEHFFEHITYEQSRNLLNECFRILRPDGTMRIAVPDYGAPRNKKFARQERDPNHTDHLQFPTFLWAKKLCEDSPFESYTISNYWENDSFHYSEIDYSLGWIKRTADNDKRNRRKSVLSKSSGLLRDLGTMLKHQVGPSDPIMQTVRGKKYRMTSIIIDFVK